MPLPTSPTMLQNLITLLLHTTPQHPTIPQNPTMPLHHLYITNRPLIRPRLFIMLLLSILQPTTPLLPNLLITLLLLNLLTMLLLPNLLTMPLPLPMHLPSQPTTLLRSMLPPTMS